MAESSASPASSAAPPQSSAAPSSAAPVSSLVISFSPNVITTPLPLLGTITPSSAVPSSTRSKGVDCSPCPTQISGLCQITDARGSISYCLPLATSATVTAFFPSILVETTLVSSAPAPSSETEQSVSATNPPVKQPSVTTDPMSSMPVVSSAQAPAWLTSASWYSRVPYSSEETPATITTFTPETSPTAMQSEKSLATNRSSHSMAPVVVRPGSSFAQAEPVSASEKATPESSSYAVPSISVPSPKPSTSTNDGNVPDVDASENGAKSSGLCSSNLGQLTQLLYDVHGDLWDVKHSLNRIIERLGEEQRDR